MIILFKSKKYMTEKYVQLMEDLQYAKRETATWRQRHTQAEIQLQAAREEIKQLKRTLEGLQETNHKLTLANRQLNEDKESMASGYSTEISTIMEEITARQKEIAQLRDVAAPGKIDQQIALRQLKYDLNEEYSARALAKQKKLQEVSALLERANYQREIDREKAKLRIEALEDSLRELQKRHETEVLDYSTRLYQATQLTKPNEDKDYLRRVKRENEQLRRKLQLSHGELTAALQQKNQVTKDYGRWMNDYQKTISDHQNELHIYKAEVQRLNDMLEHQSARKDELTLKDRERELKRVKNQLEEARDEIVFKDKKVADLQLDRVRLLNQIKTARAEREKAGSIIEEQLRQERERLMRELSDARATLDRMRGQNSQLQDKVHDITRIHSENAKRWEAAKGEQQIRKQQLRNRLKRQRSQEVIPTVDKSVDNIGVQREDNKKTLEEAVSIQKGKVKEVLSKYIQAKQRIALLEKKLKKANDKIVQLLQQKVILNSPKATTKKFEFPTEDPAVHPVPHQPHTHTKKRLGSNQSKEHSASPGKHLHIHTMNEIRPQAKQPMGYTNPNLRRQFFSPQDERLIRIQDQDANQRSYYEKSMHIKNRRLSRELRCTNHEQ